MFPLKDDVPTERFPVVTVALIALNVVVYLVAQRAGIALSPDSADFVESVVDYGAIPGELTGEVRDEGPPTWQTAFTSMFLHGGLLHIAGNMLFLWVFGNNVEDAMGRAKFLAFYLLGGLAALAGQVLVDPGSDVPTVGASGAVAGVLGGYLVLHPRARVTTLVFIIFLVTIVQIPALFFLGFWFLQQVAFGWLDLTNPTGGGGGVAYFAHIGGFVFGLLLIKAFATRRRNTAGSGVLLHR